MHWEDDALKIIENIPLPPVTEKFARMDAECSKDVLCMGKKEYKVAAGGCGSRHPQIARTVAEFTDAAGVLGILEKAVLMYRDYPQDKKEISLKERCFLTDTLQLRNQLLFGDCHQDDIVLS